VSTRFLYTLLLYISGIALITAVGAAALGVVYNLQTVSTEPILVTNLLIQSASNTLGFNVFDVNRQSQLIALIGLCQGLIGILVNGFFIALIVFRIIRINHKVLVFAKYALLSRQPDGEWRLELRICNDSKYDIINVIIKVQLVEYLESFPKTTAHKTSKIMLNYDEYLFLTAHGYLLVSSGRNHRSTKIGERIAKIDGSLLSRRFFLRVLVQGQYLNSGFAFCEFHMYNASEVHKGHWRYYTKEDLERRGHILYDEFNAFDPENDHRQDINENI
jgi:hypothetical protein